MSFSSRFALAPRRRSVWEAADSGLLLWRGSFAYILLFLGVPLAAFSCAARWFMPELKQEVYLGLWWLKPLWDRFALHVVSVRFFEPDASLGRLVRVSPSFFLRGLIGDLLWRRIGLWRASRMPVRVLEKLGGRAYRQRKALLRDGGLDFCALVTIFCHSLEYVLLAGELVFVYVMTDIFTSGSVSGFLQYTEFIAAVEPFMFAAYTVNLFLLESVYVSMGFGLYINSRVRVEGWDIQLFFENFAKNTAAGGGRKLPAGNVVRVLLCGLCLGLFTFSPHGLFAEENTAGAVPLGTLEAVLESPDFGYYTDTWNVRPKRENTEVGRKRPLFPKDWQGMKEVVGQVLRGILVVCAGALVVYLFVRFFRRGWGGRGGPAARGFSLENTAAPDPAFLVEEALSLYGRGRFREAWAACFASAIASYVRFRGLSFPPRATEYACLGIVLMDAGGAGDFAFLVERWVCLAYAGREPDDEAFSRAVSFCRGLLGESGA